MRILISGISCPLGLKTAEMLEALGHEIIGFSRNPPKGYHSCDLHDIEKLRTLAVGCDAIVHIAALSSPWGKKTDFFKHNVAGTKNLLTLGCERFIYISTPAVYFDYTHHFNITEERCAKRPVNHYAASKLAAEKLVHARGGTILRPKALFGPGDSVLMPRMLKLMKNGGIPRFSDEPTWLDITYIDNVAHAIVCAFNANRSGTYNITNGDPRPLHQMLAQVLGEMGIAYKERRLPYWMAQGAARLLELFAKKEPPLTRYPVGTLHYSQTLCIEKARQELGYEPIVTLDEGMRRYGKWWIENH